MRDEERFAWVASVTTDDLLELEKCFRAIEDEWSMDPEDDQRFFDLWQAVRKERQDRGVRFVDWVRGDE